MGNLGMYEEFATQAKRAGGVESLIKIIERNAVMKARPTTLGVGIGIGVAGTLAARQVFVSVGQAFDDRRARETLADEAKARLKQEFVDGEGAQIEAGEGES
jgi:hypothetical protein